MNVITDNDSLEIGKYYWCRHKGGAVLNNGLVSPPGPWYPKQVSCLGSQRQFKYIGDRIWACEDNNQALTLYDIVGPIPTPVEPEILETAIL